MKERARLSALNGLGEIAECPSGSATTALDPSSDLRVMDAGHRRRLSPRGPAPRSATIRRRRACVASVGVGIKASCLLRWSTKLTFRLLILVSSGADRGSNHHCAREPPPGG